MAAGLVPSLPGSSAQERRPPRVGWLDGGRAADAASHREALRQALVGYISVDTLILEERFAEEREDRLPSLAAELVKLRVDALLAVGSAAVRAARQATRALPIVMLSPRAPGAETGRGSPDIPANLTGVTFEGPQVSRRRLELVKEMLPGLKRVALHTHPGDALSLRETQAAAEGLGVTVVPVEARDPEALAKALAGLAEPRPGALIVAGASASLGQRAQIVNASTRARLPAMYAYREFVDAGGLASYGPNFGALYRRAGVLVGRVLRGAPPRDLPLEAPSRFELVVNRKAARAFGFDVPLSVLHRADEVR